MEIAAVSLLIQIFQLLKALKDDLQAEKGYAQLFVRAAGDLEVKLRRLKGLRLTPKEDKVFDQWRLECHGTLKQLRGQIRSRSGLRGSGIQKSVTAIAHRILFNPKDAERLVASFALTVSELNGLFSYIILLRR